ncbi:hypothetical protein F8S13_13480 [Chloroflexia bacterium SDU3-3]|nr:hypothetical protein F8S13_13480 [Chloroflexia bacterium SDU3-3]
MSDDPCHVACAQIDALLDGELPAAEREALMRHMAACPACRARYEVLRRTVAACRAQPEAPAALPPEVERRLLDWMLASKPCDPERPS